MDAGKKKLYRAQVTYSYSPEEDDELQLQSGEFVEVLDQVSLHLGDYL